MLTDEQVENNYKEFISLIEANVKREGVENLLKWLNARDAKIAPASTKYHLSCKGGLIQHSLNVYKRLVNLVNQEYGDANPYTQETLVLTALLHDISKINFYEIQERNAKDENGNWIKVPFYAIKEENQRVIFGSHALNSYYMLNKFVPLTYEESLAILHHMGNLDMVGSESNCKTIIEAYRKSTLAVLLHTADLLATVIDEKDQ